MLQVICHVRPLPDVCELGTVTPPTVQITCAAVRFKVAVMTTLPLPGAFELVIVHGAGQLGVVGTSEATDGENALPGLLISEVWLTERVRPLKLQVAVIWTTL